jgi:hypothetical protein
MGKLTSWSFVLILGMANLAWAQGSDFFIYANKGQTADQQEQDEFQCFRWARDTTGFDPTARPTATRPPPQKEAKQGGVAQGAVRGLVVGSAVGAVRGKKGKQSRATGAAVGGVVGGMRRNDQQRREQQNQQQWEQEQIANYERNRSQYNRAFSACMEGRGYTVR